MCAYVPCMHWMRLPRLASEAVTKAAALTLVPGADAQMRLAVWLEKSGAGFILYSTSAGVVMIVGWWVRISGGLYDDEAGGACEMRMC